MLDALRLRDQFDVIITIDDVAHGKPDPEIYLLATSRLAIPPAQCLAVEDSLPGVRAAVAAGMPCVASTNDLTRDAVHAALPLPGVQVVDDPATLEAVVRDVSLHQRKLAYGTRDGWVGPHGRRHDDAPHPGRPSRHRLRSRHQGRRHCRDGRTRPGAPSLEDLVTRLTAPRAVW